MRRRFLSALLLLSVAATAHAEPRFSGQAALDLVAAQLEFGPRAPGTEGHEACARWLIEFLREQGGKVRPHGFVYEDPYGGGRLSLTNIQASFGPRGESPLALAAHWDTRPRADRDSTAEPGAMIPGANDGASGVAVLLHLAQLFAEEPPAIPVDLLLFDAEDWGKEGDAEHYLVGSRRFVRDFPNYRPRALILLDMIGDADLRIPMEAYSNQAAPRLLRRVFDAAERLGLPAFEPVPGPAVYDDHIPFLQARIPAIDLIDFEYPAWHTMADDLDKVSAASLGQVGELLVHLVYVDFPTGG